jgi:hypothetical protein
MDQEKRGILYPNDINDKSGNFVREVLQSKHPDARIPSAVTLTAYPSLSNFVNVNITEDSVESGTRHPSGSAGLGRMDSHTLQQRMLLGFGVSSRVLREAVVAKFADWLANSFPPWAAYHALMGGRLVALDKAPRCPPTGNWQNLVALMHQTHFSSMCQRCQRPVQHQPALCWT